MTSTATSAEIGENPKPTNGGENDPNPGNDIDIEIGNQKSDEPRSKESSWKACFWEAASVFGTLFSLLLLVLFAFAAFTQSTDVEGIQWIIFYTLNAFVPAVYLIYCFVGYLPEIPFRILVTITILWSVLAILNAIRPSAETGSEGTNPELRQNSIIAMGSIAFLSSIHHHFMTGGRCFSRPGGCRGPSDPTTTTS